jgi:asparagine synthase (glutamine-hydrolysing)
VADGRAVLETMADPLRHRGPDDEGAALFDGAGIAMRRLAVIDLETGHQPIPNETNDVWLVQNGEIYNYLELREWLVSRGHRFRTRSDTEVLVHLYEEEGEALTERLKGMFAFAIYDQRNGELLLARDRFGEKPLFYYAGDDAFVFSSEIKSLVAHPLVPRELSLEALPYYLKVRFTPEPITLLRHVSILPAGHVLKLKDGQIRITRYYHPDYEPDPELNDVEVAAERVRETLSAAVERQMVSDVPLGGFLSGGIDSSSVMAFANRSRGEAVQTFTVRFPSAAYDEGVVAESVAKHLGTRHQVHQVRDATFLEEDFWRIIDHVGFPFADSSAIPMSMVSKFARRHVTVCLSGDGGDEIFGGYEAFLWGLRVRHASYLPKFVLRTAEAAVSLGSRAPWLRHTGGLRRYRRGLEVAALPEPQQLLAMHELFGDDELTELASPTGDAQLTLPRENRMTGSEPGSERWSYLRRMMSWRTKYNLPSDMLAKVDRMSMAHSLEVRAPFLDPDLAALGSRLPDDMLLRDGVGKWILRRAVRDLLPDAVFRHPKRGFSIPLHLVKNETYEALAREALLGRSPLHRLLDRNAVQKLLDFALLQQHDTAEKSVYRASHQVWSLLQLFAWVERFGVEV